MPLGLRDRRCGLDRDSGRPVIHRRLRGIRGGRVVVGGGSEAEDGGDERDHGDRDAGDATGDEQRRQRAAVGFALFVIVVEQQRQLGVVDVVRHGRRRGRIIRGLHRGHG